jgi:hypothetical protein
MMPGWRVSAKPTILVREDPPLGTNGTPITPILILPIHNSSSPAVVLVHRIMQ